jgi:hypothetical protein
MRQRFSPGPDPTLALVQLARQRPEALPDRTLIDHAQRVLQNPPDSLTNYLTLPKIFSRLRGTKTARTEQSSAAAQTLQQTTSIDNPKTSPYPIWQASSAYVAGYKVVWQGVIYQANWWSQGDAPGSSSTSASGSPWLLIGPVPHEGTRR